MENDRPNTGGLSQIDTDALIEELNKLFTPILIAGEIDPAIADQATAAASGNLIKFDNETRKAQLISVCARLIGKYKRQSDYAAYIEAAAAAKALKLKLQKDNHGASVALADEYLHRLIATADNAQISKAASALSSIKVTLG